MKYRYRVKLILRLVTRGGLTKLPYKMDLVSFAGLLELI